MPTIFIHSFLFRSCCVSHPRMPTRRNLTFKYGWWCWANRFIWKVYVRRWRSRCEKILANHIEVGRIGKCFCYLIFVHFLLLLYLHLCVAATISQATIIYAIKWSNCELCRGSGVLIQSAPFNISIIQSFWNYSVSITSANACRGNRLVLIILYFSISLFSTIIAFMDSNMVLRHNRDCKRSLTAIVCGKYILLWFDRSLLSPCIDGIIRFIFVMENKIEEMAYTKASKD